ncbi:LysR family substrate-binding domain-containing protein [cf. Phormidesmis sp. LEGE 11477]|uniref:LysR family substrate-binding domain-containing protein n=1 Tax=cf. Phormidesmis sp. LEGE 11477 TaxID=1828680 RepID=UPI00187FB359|nr:LysR family substrate-binding domain-containing protein [cf. Phormidesmis sp. LEGE 11477]MBE9062214.1 LysR family substrate-binding domain-containing protein [cf. Phormidesmis sp. LEGE 11477]
MDSRLLSLAAVLNLGVTTDRLAIALPTAHPLAKQNDTTLSDLASEPFVMWPAVEGRGFHHRVIQLCTADGFVPKVVQEAHQMHGVLALVAVEIGVAIVPASMTGFRAEEIVYYPLDAESTGFTLFLCHRDEPLSATAQNFMQLSHDSQKLSHEHKSGIGQIAIEILPFYSRRQGGKSD